MLTRSDETAFDQLKWLVDHEGENLASEDGLGLLANIGVVKGRSFGPDAETKAILNAAAKTAYKTSRVIGRMPEIGGRDLRIWKDRRWLNPINNVSEPGNEKTIDPGWRNKGMVSLSPGKGAFYRIAFNDTDDKPLSGDASYKVTLPPNVPVARFWSLTLYESENASGLATEARRFPSLGSRDKPVQNADGTTDLYIGPKAPAGKEANWLATAPGRGFFAILRLYGPEEAAINYSWKPSDIQKVN